MAFFRKKSVRRVDEVRVARDLTAALADHTIGRGCETQS
jgi:hypothetical protein